MGNSLVDMGIASLIALILTSIAAYITHLWWTLATLFGDGEMVLKDLALAILGALFPPIGVIHGFIIWF